MCGWEKLEEKKGDSMRKDPNWPMAPFLLGSIFLFGLQILYFGVGDSEAVRVALSVGVIVLVTMCCHSTRGKIIVSRRAVLLPIASYVIAVVLAGTVTLRNIQSVLYARELKDKGATLPKDQTLQSGALKGLEISALGGDPLLPTSYVGKIQDGLDLLARTGNSAKPVLSLDFSNPFNVARGVRPPDGSTLAWQLGFLYSASVAPDVGQVFNGTEVVMIPKKFGDGDQQSLAILKQHYGSYMDEHFKAAGESSQWYVLERK
jgi:hypothetical protein